MEGRMSAYDMSFDVETDNEDDIPHKPPSYCLEDKGSDIAIKVENEEWEEKTNNHLRLAISELDNRSQDILESRWLSDDKLTLHDLAQKYGVSAERIRQLEKAAMDKIKVHMQA